MEFINVQLSRVPSFYLIRRQLLVNNTETALNMLSSERGVSRSIGTHSENDVVNTTDQMVRTRL
jgi:hypothetical protein